MSAQTEQAVTTLAAVRALFALNRECKSFDNRALKELVYSLKDKAIAALYAGGYCVGAEIEDEEWLVRFVFVVEQEAFVFHLPLARIAFKFEEREPTVVGKHTPHMRLTPKECGVCVRTVSSWLETR